MMAFYSNVLQIYGFIIGKYPSITTLTPLFPLTMKLLLNLCPLTDPGAITLTPLYNSAGALRRVRRGACP